MLVFIVVIIVVTDSNNVFFTILIFLGATLLSSYGIDYSLILILNKFVCRFLAKMKNPCIYHKDCAPILVGFGSGMKVYD
jgi:hypothetical protein